MIRQPNLPDVAGHVRRDQPVPQPGPRQREGLRERPEDGYVGRGGRHLRGRAPAELDVGLVHHDQRPRRRQLLDDLDRLGVPGGVVRRAHEHDVGIGGHGPVDVGGRDRERRLDRHVHDVRVRHPGQARVQRVRRLERHRTAAGTSIGEHQLLDDLVGPVPHHQPLDRPAGPLGEERPELHGVPLRIPVQRGGGEVRLHVGHEARWQRVGTLVRVQPDGHRPLGRAVRLRLPQAGARALRLAACATWFVRHGRAILSSVPAVTSSGSRHRG